MRKIAEVVEKVEKLGRQYNSHVRRIGELFDDVADWIEAQLPDGFDRFTAAGLQWRRNWCSSNIGSYGSAFGLEIDMSGMRDWELISGEPGRAWFLHGDFHTRVSTGTPRQYREAAKRLPVFLEKLAQSLMEASGDASTQVEALERVVEAIQKS